MNSHVLVRILTTRAGLISALSRIRTQILTLFFSGWYFCRATFELLHREVLSSEVDAELPEPFQLFRGEVHISYTEEMLAHGGCDLVLVDVLMLLSACQRETKSSFAGVKFVREQRECFNFVCSLVVGFFQAF